MSAEKVGPLSGAGKKSSPLSMNARSPGFVNVPVAFTTESIALREVDQLPVEEPQLISIPCLMTIETPSHRFRVMEFDIRVFFLQFSLLSIHLHRGMAVAAGKHSFRHRGRRNRKFFFRPRRKGRKAGLQQKEDGYDRIAYWMHLLGVKRRKSQIGA